MIAPGRNKSSAALARVPSGQAAAFAAQHRLLRASEVERNYSADSALGRTLAWVREFLARPHPELGRTGPVCPFTPAALSLDTIWLTEITDIDADPRRIAEVIGQYRDVFLEIEPRDGPATINKAIMVVFPTLGTDGARIVDDVQAELKARFVEVGLMLGEFHAANQSPGLRNPDFRPLCSPIPMLAMRHMVESDLPFLRRTIDAPVLRASFVRSYLRRLGSAVRPSNFEQAIEALIEAELQLRSDGSLPELTTTALHSASLKSASSCPFGGAATPSERASRKSAAE